MKQWTSEETIVPTLRVGMQLGTLRVPLLDRSSYTSFNKEQPCPPRKPS